MNRADAEEYTQSLGQIVAGSWRQVALAKRLGVPKALGLTTEQWVEDRLGGYIRLSIPDRREAVKELTAEGMSQREIGDVLGVGEATVNRDLHNVPDETPDANKPNGSGDGDAAGVPNETLDATRRQQLAEDNKRETLLRLTEAAYRGTTAWVVDEFAAEFVERLSDQTFRKKTIERLRLNGSAADFDAVRIGAEKLINALENLRGGQHDGAN